MHILIAEDHPDLRKILTLYLQKEGYQVSVVSNGQEAITYLMERCGLKKEAKNNLGLTFSKSRHPPRPPDPGLDDAGPGWHPDLP